MGQAVLSISKYNGWSQALKHKERRTAHWILQVIGSALAIAGSIIRINAVENSYTTAHGILGNNLFILYLPSAHDTIFNISRWKLESWNLRDPDMVTLSIG